MFQKKTMCTDKELQTYVFRLNNIKRGNQTGTPAEIFFRRKPRCGFLIVSKTENDYKRLQQLRQALTNRRNRKGNHHYSISEYKAGERVRVQNLKSLKWSSLATIPEKRREDGGKTSDSYYVDSDESGLLLRSGRHLRVMTSSEFKAKSILKRKHNVGFWGLTAAPLY